jgi:hypothetical protein
VAGLPAKIGGSPAVIEDASIEFRDGATQDPSLRLRASGAVLGEPFAAHATGPLSRLLHEIVPTSPVSAELVRWQLEGVQPPFQPQISLLAPAAQAAGLEVYSWTAIAGPPSTTPAAPAGGTPP